MKHLRRLHRQLIREGQYTAAHKLLKWLADATQGYERPMRLGFGDDDTLLEYRLRTLPDGVVRIHIGAYSGLARVRMLGAA